MNGYLLDTHTAVWFFNGDETLSQTANRIIRDISNRVYLSMASAWELAIKIGIGKMKFGGRSAGFIHLAEECDITILPIKSVHLSVLEKLPLIHWIINGMTRCCRISRIYYRNTGACIP